MANKSYYEWDYAPNNQRNMTVHEEDKPQVIIYNHKGEPLTKPKQAMGFDLSPTRKQEK